MQLITSSQTYLCRSFHLLSLLFRHSLKWPTLKFLCDRQFHVDPVTSQTFFREHVNGLWGMWRPLEQSDFHPPRPATHNVRILTNRCPALVTNPFTSMFQVLSNKPLEPMVALDPSLQPLAPPPSTQPTARIPAWDLDQDPAIASQAPPSQSQRNTRQARRMTVHTIPFARSDLNLGGDGPVVLRTTDLVKLKCS
jgi:hypothetical protein